MYYLVYGSGDGLFSISPLIKEELLEMIKEDNFGPIKFNSEIEESDLQYWDRSAVIIKGEIVVPKPKKVIEEYDIE